MRRRIGLNFGAALAVLLVIAAAVGSSYFLGKLYLGIIKEGVVPKSTKVGSGEAKSVVAQDEQKRLFLNPIPVYYLQAGVYSDMEGAKQALTPFEELGYIPYITQQSPHKIWIGVYQKREDTESIKLQLREKEYSSFTGSTVINGGSLLYGKGSEAFINQVSPVLELYTAWLAENLPLFQGSDTERLNWTEIEKQISVAERVYLKLKDIVPHVNSNSESINHGFGELWDTVERYNEKLNVLRKQRNSEAYYALQYELLSFVDKYHFLWKEISNVSKT